MNKEERNSFRKEIIGKLEEQWAKNNRPEDDLFYYHPSEDKIVLSHALFWVMTQNIKGKVGKENGEVDEDWQTMAVEDDVVSATIDSVYTTVYLTLED